MNHNPKLTAIGIENMSQPFGKASVWDELIGNVFTYKTQAESCLLLNYDCFEIEHSDIPVPVDFYYFDGEHSKESQAKALPHYFDAMAPLFLFMVDDANWPSVREGTAEGFEALKDRVKIEHEWHLSGKQAQDDAVWHNGVAIYVCSKL